MALGEKMFQTWTNNVFRKILPMTNNDISIEHLPEKLGGKNQQLKETCMITRRTALKTLAGGAAAILLPGIVRATGSFPNKPVRIDLPTACGSAFQDVASASAGGESRGGGGKHRQPVCG
jgi:hypothetical protein